MDFVAVDGLEAALAKVRFRGGGEDVELAQAAGGQAVEQLADDAPAEALAAMLRPHGHRADQRRELISLGAAARDELRSSRATMNVFQ